MCRKVGSIAIVLILALCTAGAAFALPLDPEAAEAPGKPGLLDGLRDWLFDWLNRMAGGKNNLDSLWLEGCHIDPNGGCLGNH